MDSIKKIKRKPKEWKKILAHSISDKDLLSRSHSIQNKTIFLNNDHLIFKMDKGLEKIFLQRRYANRQHAKEKTPNTTSK